VHALATMSELAAFTRGAKPVGKEAKVADAGRDPG